MPPIMHPSLLPTDGTNKGDTMSCHFHKIQRLWTCSEAQFEHFSLTSFFTSFCFSLTISIEKRPTMTHSRSSACSGIFISLFLLFFHNIYYAKERKTCNATLWTPDICHICNTTLQKLQTTFQKEAPFNQCFFW